MYVALASSSPDTSEITWSAESRLPVPVTIREAFTYYLDITNPPTPQLLHLFAMMVRALAVYEFSNCINISECYCAMVWNLYHLTNTMPILITYLSFSTFFYLGYSKT